MVTPDVWIYDAFDYEVMLSDDPEKIDVIFS